MKSDFRDAAVAVAITAEQYEGADDLATFERSIVEGPDRQNVVTVGTEDRWYDDRIFACEGFVSSGTALALRAGDDDADLALLFTSGTMGKPRAFGCRTAPLSKRRARAGAARPAWLELA